MTLKDDSVATFDGALYEVLKVTKAARVEDSLAPDRDAWWFGGSKNDV